MIDAVLYRIKKIIPPRLFRALQPLYHYTLAFLAALVYRFPARKLIVVGVTGTKGKTSVIEIANAIFEAAGYTTAVANTVRFKIGNESHDNEFKMTMPGRFFLQRFLRRAVRQKCNYAFIEMTSEGAKLFRHAFIALDALIFTNLAPEHIESHGGYEAYRDAKLSFARALERSSKKRRVIVANRDDNEGGRFLAVDVPEKYPYGLADGEPYVAKKEGLEFTFRGRRIAAHLSGVFNLSNILAAAAYAASQGIGVDTVARAVESFRGIPGRMEKIDEGQQFTVIVDYAHTPDSLEKVYEVFQSAKKICVLGAAGGGRDAWKRKEMGRIAGKHCTEIVLTNEDPYDEDPESIVRAVAEGIARPVYAVIMDRRAAIRHALLRATAGDAVIITGKGTDPYLMGPNNTKLPWSDAAVAREELRAVLMNATLKS
ncbi:MAG: UDP-N-acetylmuramyl-tripeptide synthetase [Parcubacteria group bacterium]|nr:UDP-N-acetylmuramyl-tripeptide synthetase [Parcubacteria group bacterium]